MSDHSSRRLGALQRWILWAAKPPPWLLVVGVVASVVAVSLCAMTPKWGAVVAVVYQAAGAVLAVAQFASLQQRLNPGWLTREVREWWEQRPREIPPIVGSVNITLGPITGRAYGSSAPPDSTPVEEQLRKIWQKLAVTDSTMVRLEDDLKLQKEDFNQRLEESQNAARGFALSTEERLSTAITSAPLQAAIGFWLILLGAGMQIYLAWKFPQ